MFNSVVNKPLSKLATIVVILKKNVNFEGKMDIWLSKISWIRVIIALAEPFLGTILTYLLVKFGNQVILKGRFFT